MAFNPFAKFQTRSQTLPSSSVSPISFVNGRLVPQSMVDINYLHNSDVWAVIYRIASDVAACDFVGPAPIKDVLNRPNNLINGFSFWQTVVTQLLLSGNSYVTIEHNGSLPSRLEFVPPSQMLITLEDNSADMTYTVTYDDERPQRDFNSKDVMHFRIMAHGANGQQYIGHSPLEALAKEIGIQDYSKNLTLDTLKNAINPNITLTVPEGTLDGEAKENIRTEFEKVNGKGNNGRAIVLDQGLKIDTIQINADVAKFLNNNDFSKTQISSAFLVPAEYLNGEGDQQSNLDQTVSLYANSLQTYLKSVSSEVSMKFNAQIKLDPVNAIDVDHQKLIDNLAKLSTGKMPVMQPYEVMEILKRNGVFGLE